MATVNERQRVPLKHLPIYVTQPFMPPLEEFLPYLREIWDSKVLTNGGACHDRLVAALRESIGVGHVALFSSGTTALLTALKVLGITGEVITTPYTFVATTHALKWSGIEPVFVDIDPRTLNLDPRKIEAAITPRTSAILPVHCYGNACDVRAIGETAGRHGLPVIYDGAHAFGVDDEGGSILRHGDLSVLSFHATKVFNTLEGGAIVCHDDETLARINRLKNFGYVDEVTVTEVGINGKMNEISAAFGLLQLRHLRAGLDRRAAIDRTYRTCLNCVAGIGCLEVLNHERGNHGFFPIMVEEAYPMTRDQLYDALRAAGVHARRYFYPLVAAFPMYAQLRSASRTNLPIASRVAERVICLPIYPAMTDAEQARVVEVICKAGRI